MRFFLNACVMFLGMRWATQPELHQTLNVCAEPLVFSRSNELNAQLSTYQPDVSLGIQRRAARVVFTTLLPFPALVDKATDKARRRLAALGSVDAWFGWALAGTGFEDWYRSWAA
jgi:hypothetical protein